MSALFQIRRDTTAGWTATPSTLTEGEFGLDTTLKQIKVGNGSSPWGSLPWLGGTLAYYGSPTSGDLNNATNSVIGLYRFSSISATTNGPTTAPSDIKVADGGINMMVLPFGTVVLQYLWTDGDGTQPQKSYTRIFDGSWRAWTPQSLWGVSATEGVDAKVRDIEVQRNATVKGDLSIQGTTNIGDSAGDVGVFQQGAVGTPSQTFANDTNTGAYSPAADEYGIVTAGTRRVHVTDALTKIENAFRTEAASTLVGLATMLAGASLNGQRAQAVGNATSLTDALNWQTFLANTAIAAGASSGSAYTASNGATWTLTSLSPATWTPSVAGTFDGIVITVDSGGNVESARTRVFNNTAVPTANSGATSYSILIAFRRS